MPKEGSGESPLRHQLVTKHSLLRFYLMRPSLRPIGFPLDKGRFAESETVQAGDGGAEVVRGEVRVPHRHRPGRVAKKLLELLEAAPAHGRPRCERVAPRNVTSSSLADSTVFSYAVRMVRVRKTRPASLGWRLLRAR